MLLKKKIGRLTLPDFKIQQKGIYLRSVILVNKQTCGSTEVSLPNSRFTIKLQSTRQCGTVKEQTYGSMEQKREPKNRSMQIKTTDFLTKKKAIPWRKAHLFDKWCQNKWMSITNTAKTNSSLFPTQCPAALQASGRDRDSGR